MLLKEDSEGELSGLREERRSGESFCKFTLHSSVCTLILQTYTICTFFCVIFKCNADIVRLASGFPNLKHF